MIPELSMTTPAHILSDLALEMRHLVIQISMSYVIKYSYLDDTSRLLCFCALAGLHIMCRRVQEYD